MELTTEPLNGRFIQENLDEMTDQYTVPNLFIAGNYIGDSVKLEEIYENGTLKELFDNAGVEHKL